MRELGFRGFRVRHHEMVARIELPEADFVRAMEMREEIVAAMREAGYAYAALDLAGFRSGSQNLMLRPKVVAASTAEG